MIKSDELEQLDKAIKNAEISQKSIQANIDKLSKEINTLTQLKDELEENLKFHKRDGIVPLAHEYGKTKKELTKVTNRLNLITSDYKKSVRAIKDVQEIVVKFKRDHIKLLNSSENNVVYGLFGVKRGKK